MQKFPEEKNAPPTGGLVFQATGTIFELFHDERKMPFPLGGHVFPPTGTIFELIQDIIGTNHLTKFHDDRTINVASRVLTRFYKSMISTETIFELIQDIIRTNLLTKFHEDRKINKNAPPPGGYVFQPTRIIF
ncbi:hypothetical protein DPMN_012417 [Dreissena polymorpha]|uniref:Uncharacterized protein n=1 Tax=Dreissena polymorpha TaxID=45954 RepID=A0A9D4N6X9_DREPO|nr:hypothetical protein DPMN_012417 [Dreissena polymorpha]